MRFPCFGRPLWATCAGVVLAFTPPGVAQTPLDSELWYTVTLQGEHAGWMRYREQTSGDRITTEVQWSLTVSRAGTAVESRKQGRFVETPEGKPISFWSMQDLGSTPREVQYDFGPAEISVKVTESGRTTTSKRPLPAGQWQTPHAAGEFILARMRSGADRLSVNSIDILGDIEPVITTRELLDRETTIEVRGKKVHVSRWKTVQSSMPTLASIECFDPEGVLVRSEVDLGGVSIVSLLSDEQTAKRVSAGPEMMLKTFVRPSKPIPRSARLKRAVFELSVDEGELPTIPVGGAQTVEPSATNPQRTRLTIDVNARPPAEVDANAYLHASELVSCDDEQVVELARRATRSSPGDDMRRAEAIRVFVGRYIRRKSLGIGLASAAQVARDREGDCTEHAVLATAMLRAQGIPARIATGLVLVDEFAGQKSIFGYHMWSQALINGAWVDFDATLPHRFDATHIALEFSEADDAGFLAEMTSLLPVMGRLKIDVVSLDY